MKLNEFQVFGTDLQSLIRTLTFWGRDVAAQVNALSEDRIQAYYQATSSVPTAGSYQVGDFVRNSAPSELGAVGSKYVLLGWVCTSASPLTFKECRALTGA